jgi:hypothetical protein
MTRDRDEDFIDIEQGRLKPFYGDSGVSGYNLLDGYDRDEDESFFHEQENHERSKGKSQTSIRLFSYDEMVNMPEADWLVDYVIPRRAKSVLFGQSDSLSR